MAHPYLRNTSPLRELFYKDRLLVLAQIYGYIGTRWRLQEGGPGMDPMSQELQLQRVGVAWDKHPPRRRVLQLHRHSG